AEIVWNRLADRSPEIERTVEDDVDDREPVPGDEGLAGEEPIEPRELVAHDGLEAIRGLGQDTHAILEHREALGVAEAVVEMLGDTELDPALPHAGFRPVLGRGAEERRRRVLLLEVLEDRDGLAEDAPVVELEGRYLPPGVALEVGAAPVLATEQID